METVPVEKEHAEPNWDRINGCDMPPYTAV